ncbi:hypothetical protein FS749_013936, partial [Ceratobasidium sp. UAMH 11750]
NGAEEAWLREVYKEILSRPDCDPLALHEACLRGELFDYCHELTNPSLPEEFRRFMKNPYPLRNPEETPNSDESDEAETRSSEVGNGPSLYEELASRLSRTGSIEHSELRAMLKNFWQSRSG